MKHNNFEIKIGQRFKYSNQFIGEITDVRSHSDVTIKVVQVLHTYYNNVGRCLIQTMNDSWYVYLPGQDKSSD